MNNKHPGRVEDYTTANLVLIFVNMLWIFGVIWSTWGIAPVIFVALVLNHLITRLQIVKAQAEIAFQARSDK
jgi:hypothetical protein